MNLEYASPGDVVIQSQLGKICSTPLGSCIAVIAYDQYSKTGGMAHVMLPYEAPQPHASDQNKYAVNAISTLIDGLEHVNVPSERMEFCLIGGANVLTHADEKLVKSIRDSVLHFLDNRGIKALSSHLGGNQRRIACLDIGEGRVYCSHGDQRMKLLYDYFSKETEYCV